MGAPGRPTRPMALYVFSELGVRFDCFFNVYSINQSHSLISFVG